MKETGVLAGSEIFFNTVDATTERLFYYVGCCGHYYCTRGYQVSRKDMDRLLLILVEDGALALEYQGREYTVLPRSAILLDGDCPHRYSAPQYAEFLWLHLAGGNCFALCEHLTRSAGGVVHEAGAVSGQIRQLVSQFATKQAYAPAGQSLLLYSILCGLMPEARAPESGTPAERAEIYIRANLGGNLSLRRIAAVACVSPSHLLRLFREAYGTSPHEYVIRLRMDRARHLLKTTRMPVKAVAAEVGYRNESSFTSAFTERVGVSPRRFRELPFG